MLDVKKQELFLGVFDFNKIESVNSNNFEQLCMKKIFQVKIFCFFIFYFKQKK